MDFIIELLFVIAPIFILAGGIMILTAGAKPDQVSVGKKIITNAIVGILIALLAWTLINLIFISLSGFTTDSEGNKRGIIFTMPWNEIDCSGGGVTDPGSPPVTEGEYCVCEVPVYDLDPSDSSASIIATNVKTQKLANKDICVEKCISDNYTTYCPSTLKPDEANLYCAEKSYLENTKACYIYLGSSTSCGISTKCYDSEQECLNDGSITYKSQCYLDGQNYCVCSAGDTRCGNDPNKYALLRDRKEEFGGGNNLWNCSSTETRPCRLNCERVECKIENRCSVLSPASPCSIGGGSFTCQRGVKSQILDASSELEILLGCMDNRLPLEAKEISSISDNSEGRCLNEWNSQCGSGEDSCDGICCGHSKCSLHYGGFRNSESDTGPAECPTGTRDCRIFSWAVDFANEAYKNEIAEAAKWCADNIDVLKFYGGAKGLCLVDEGDHVHVELQERAIKSGCTKKSYCQSNL